MTLPNPKELEVFCAVVEAGGINAAARRLSVSRSVVSKRIADLETALGARLLHRSTSQSTLTPTGEVFYEQAVSVLHALEEAVNTTRGVGDGLTGTLRITLPADAAGSFLQQPLLDFALSHPKLTMVVDMDDRMVDLSASGYDVAIRIGRLRDSALRARKLCDSPRVVCAAPRYFAEHGLPKTPDDLVDHATIGYGNTMIGCVWRFGEEGAEPQSIRVAPRLTFNNGKAMSAAATKGLGITVLPKFIVADELARGTLQAVTLSIPPVSDSVYAVFPSGRTTPLKVRAFIDFFAMNLRNNGLQGESQVSRSP